MNISISREDLASVKSLNEDQKYPYKEIINAIINAKPLNFFIDGPRGIGKTFLYRALLASIRSQRKIALAIATSGVAASILPNGRTAPSRFKVPIDLFKKKKKVPIDRDGKLCCNAGKSLVSQLFLSCTINT